MTRVARFGARAIVLAAAFAVSTGCGEGSRRGITVVDSAGVEVVTNLPGRIEAAEAWSLSAEPVVEIGSGVDPDVALFRVTAVTPLDGGRVAVGTNAPPQVLVFERDGTLGTTLGQEGDGPGEFSSVWSVVPLDPDSIAVWDADRRRISVFTGAGRYVREVDLSAIAPLTAMAAPDAGSNAGLTRLLPSTSGAWVLFGEGVLTSDPRPGVIRPELPAYRITTGGEELATFGPFPGMEWFHGGPAGALPLPFGARTYGTTAGDVLVVGTAEATELRIFARTGELARIVRWPDRDRTVRGPFLSSWSHMVEGAEPGIGDLVESVPRRERFPAYEGVVATDTGEILVGEYAGPVGIWPLRRADHGPEALQPERRVPARRWLVFDPDGALAATVSTPEGFEPYAVREGRVWGVYSDELDVESIRAYELSRR